MFKLIFSFLVCASFSLYSQNTLLENALKTSQSILSQDNFYIVDNKYTFINELCSSLDCDDCFHVVDVNIVAERYELWHKHLPNVTPFYAVKTNNDFVITSVLANFGIGFDCASKSELEHILNLGVDPAKIVFAHPRKPNTALNYAKDKGVDLLTFDSTEELHKILGMYPTARLLLRIKTDDSMSGNPLSQKFGASIEESYEILDEALTHGANIVGIAFHVGSNCTQIETYQKAIQDSAILFRYCSQKYNKKLSLLDLGGGWTGNDDNCFIKIAASINELLTLNFPKETKFIAEPGRFFATKTTTLVMKILGKRKLPQENKIHYYLANGAYGFFMASIYYGHDLNKILTEGWVVKVLSKNIKSDHLFDSLLWGPTCDSGDKILDGILLPEMETDDFIAVADSGSYTKCCETSFNGIPISKPIYICEIPMRAVN